MSENEIRAAAVREAAAYLGRIHRNGLVSKRIMLDDLGAVAYRMEQGMTARGSMRAAAEVRSTEVIRCDYCGDDLPSVKSRAHIPTTPDLQRLGFAADKVVCPECVARVRSTDTTNETKETK